MNINDVMDEMLTALATLPGELNLYGWNARKITPPCALVPLPEFIDYQGTYGPGMTEAELIVHVVVSGVSGAAARKVIGGYLAKTGDASIRQLFDTYAWTSCDDVTVTRAEPGIYTSPQNADHLSAAFTCSITGS